MITLSLDWREVLWWMQGGMAGSHLRWSVYEDMVNRVWPQCTEQERRNIFLIMRRDLGTYWRPDGWNGHSHMTEKGEGPWKPAAGMLTYSDDKRYDPAKCITDITPWEYFRRVLARFNPDNQYRVTMKVDSKHARNELMRMGLEESAKSGIMRIHTYKWDDKYYIDWNRYCDESLITNIEKLEIPDEETM